MIVPFQCFSEIWEKNYDFPEIIEKYISSKFSKKSVKI